MNDVVATGRHGGRPKAQTSWPSRPPERGGLKRLGHGVRRRSDIPPSPGVGAPLPSGLGSRIAAERGHAGLLSAGTGASGRARDRGVQTGDRWSSGPSGTGSARTKPSRSLPSSLGALRRCGPAATGHVVGHERCAVRSSSNASSTSTGCPLAMRRANSRKPCSSHSNQSSTLSGQSGRRGGAGTPRPQGAVGQGVVICEWNRDEARMVRTIRNAWAVAAGSSCSSAPPSTGR